MNSSFFGDMLQSIAERGRALIDRTRDRRGGAEQRSTGLVALCEELLSTRGEASGVALARELLSQYAELTTGPRIAFFEALASGFGPDRDLLNAAVKTWQSSPTEETAAKLHRASEPRRLELFRRLNLAPNGTTALVRMREQLLDALDHREDLEIIDDDFLHLFSSWFNRGFLILRRIDWSTPARILEKIIRYEAVHEIRDWNDLRKRTRSPRAALLRFFPPGTGRRAVDLCRGCAPPRHSRQDRRDPVRERPTRGSRSRDLGGVLFHFQLSDGAHRRIFRAFPDQTGGGGRPTRDAAAVHLRDTLACARFCRMAQARNGERGIGHDQ